MNDSVKRSLEEWNRKKQRTRRYHDEEQKRLAVSIYEACASKGSSLEHVAEALGVSNTSLRNWKREVKGKKHIAETVEMNWAEGLNKKYEKFLELKKEGRKELSWALAINIVDTAARSGYTKEQVCTYLGISDKNYYRWKSRLPKNAWEHWVSSTPDEKVAIDTETTGVSADNGIKQHPVVSVSAKNNPKTKPGNAVGVVEIRFSGDDIELHVDVSSEQAHRLQGVMESLAQMFGNA